MPDTISDTPDEASTPQIPMADRAVSKICALLSAVVVGITAVGCRSAEKELHEVVMEATLVPPKTPKEAEERCIKYCRIIWSAAMDVARANTAGRAGDVCTGLEAIAAARTVCAVGIKGTPFPRAAELAREVGSLDVVGQDLEATKNRLGKPCTQNQKERLMFRGMM